MKIITWNCNGAFRKKYSLLEAFDADLLIIQECEDPAQSTAEYKNWAGEYLWIGDNKNKGLGVFSRKGQKLEKLNWDSGRLQLFLPFKFNDKATILAIWTKQAGSKHFGYIGQLWKYLQLHKEKLTQENTILCGDWNSNAIWHDHEAWWNHLDVVRELEEIDIYSLYHGLHNKKQGQEIHPTLYMYRKRERPFHIDYIFTHKNFVDHKASLDVGAADVWLAHSDHMPIMATIPLENTDFKLRK